MKKRFIYSILLLALIFTNCKKEEYNPSQNQLIVVDQKNNTTTTSKPIYSGLNGNSSDDFDIYTTGAGNNQFDIIMSFNQSIPNPIIFNSTGISQGVTLYIRTYAGTIWTATQGTAQVNIVHDKNPSEKCPKYGKITFNNVQFIRDIHNYNNTGISDTVWVSGIISAHRSMF